MGVEVRAGWLRQDYGVVTSGIDEMSYIVAPDMRACAEKVGNKQTTGTVLHVSMYEMTPTFSIPIPSYLSLPWTSMPTLSQSEQCHHENCFNDQYCHKHNCFNCGRYEQTTSSTPHSLVDFLISKITKTNDKGFPIPIFSRGGVCFLCQNVGICNKCCKNGINKDFELTRLKPVLSKTKTMESDIMFTFMLWACPGCRTALPNKHPLSFTDQLFMFVEKMTSKHFPINVAFHLGTPRESFIGFHEMFILLAEFGGVHHIAYSGNALIQAHRAYQSILRGVGQDITLSAFKRWLVQCFLPLDFFAMPVLINLSKVSRTSLMKTLVKRVRSRKTSREIPPTTRHAQAYRLQTYFRLNFGPQVKVCELVASLPEFSHTMSLVFNAVSILHVATNSWCKD